MENFNYEEFQPKWITEYHTIYYSNEISKSNRTKLFLESFLSKKLDSEIQNAYFKIFLLEEWKTKNFQNTITDN